MSQIEWVEAVLSRMIFTPTEAKYLTATIAARTIRDEPMTERPSVSEAVDAVRAAAYEIHDPGTPENGMRIVHTVEPGNVGKDFDVEYVVLMVRVAGRGRLEWIDRDGRHNLRIDRGYAGTIDVEAIREGSTR